MTENQGKYVEDRPFHEACAALRFDLGYIAAAVKAVRLKIVPETLPDPKNSGDAHNCLLEAERLTAQAKNWVGAAADTVGCRQQLHDEEERIEGKELVGSGDAGEDSTGRCIGKVYEYDFGTGTPREKKIYTVPSPIDKMFTQKCERIDRLEQCLTEHLTAAKVLHQSEWVDIDEAHDFVFKFVPDVEKVLARKYDTPTVDNSEDSDFDDYDDDDWEDDWYEEDDTELEGEEDICDCKKTEPVLWEGLDLPAGAAPADFCEVVYTWVNRDPNSSSSDGMTVAIGSSLKDEEEMLKAYTMPANARRVIRADLCVKDCVQAPENKSEAHPITFLKTDHTNYPAPEVKELPKRGPFDRPWLKTYSKNVPQWKQKTYAEVVAEFERNKTFDADPRDADITKEEVAPSADDRIRLLEERIERMQDRLDENFGDV